MIPYVISNRVGLVGFHLGGRMFLVLFVVISILSGIFSFIALKNLGWDIEIFAWVICILLPITNTISILLLSIELYEEHKNNQETHLGVLPKSEFDYLISLVDDNNKITQYMEYRCDNKYENFNDIELGFTAHDEIKEMLDLIYDDSLTVNENHDKLTKLLSVTLLDDNYVENYYTKQCVSNMVNAQSKFMEVIQPKTYTPKYIELEDLIEGEFYFIIRKFHEKVSVHYSKFNKKSYYSNGTSYCYEFKRYDIDSYNLNNDYCTYLLTDDIMSVKMLAESVETS